MSKTYKDAEQVRDRKIPKNKGDHKVRYLRRKQQDQEARKEPLRESNDYVL